MADIVEAPWSDEQVASLNAYQVSGVFHEYTCMRNHLGSRMLLATRAGWVCPTCSYTQNWAHAFTADWQWTTTTRLSDGGFDYEAEGANTGGTDDGRPRRHGT